MTFDHDCLPEDAAQAEMHRLLAAHPDLPPLVGQWSRSVCLTVLALASFFCGGLILQSAADGAAMHTVGFALVIMSVLLGLAAWFRSEAEAEPRATRATIKADYVEASNSDLAWLNTITAQYPAVASSVQAWLRDGKVIRQRDLRAVRALTVRHEPVVQRQQLLHQLRAGDGAHVGEPS